MAPYVYHSLSSLFGLVRAQSESKSRGWGERIEWMTLEEGKKVAVAEKKPLMVVVHSSTCPACNALKWRFAKANQIFDLSKSFAMVNLATDAGEVPQVDDFAPDGNYVPRIMFYSPNGYLLRNACDVNRQQYKFNYDSDWAIANMMRDVIDLFD